MTSTRESWSLGDGNAVLTISGKVCIHVIFSCGVMSHGIVMWSHDIDMWSHDIARHVIAMLHDTVLNPYRNV